MDHFPGSYKPLPPQVPVPTQRMTTGIERVFRQTPDPGIYQEVFLHFIHFLDSEGNTTRSKLDKQIVGKLWRVIREGETFGTQYGSVDYEFPDGVTRRLVGLGTTFEDLTYGSPHHDPSKGML
jgi:hypothetical protein